MKSVECLGYLNPSLPFQSQKHTIFHPLVGNWLMLSADVIYAWLPLFNGGEGASERCPLLSICRMESPFGRTLRPTDGLSNSPRHERGPPVRPSGEMSRSSPAICLLGSLAARQDPVKLAGNLKLTQGYLTLDNP